MTQLFTENGTTFAWILALFRFWMFTVQWNAQIRMFEIETTLNPEQKLCPKSFIVRCFFCPKSKGKKKTELA